MALVLAGAVAAAILPLGGVAHAQWTVATGTSKGYAKALSVPGGNTPAASVNVRNVDLSWTAVDLPSGTPINTYRVTRYDTGGTPQTVLSSCSGTVTGLSCTEQAVPPGTWRYTVTPVFQNWVGAESAQSSAVTVQAPSLSLAAPTTLTTLSGTLTGNLSDYLSGQVVTFRLDDPSTGLLLVGSTSPAVIGAAGSATLSVVVPPGTTNGTHTLYAVGSAGDTASASFDVNVTPPSPSALLTADGGGQAGRPQQGDRVEVTFSQRLAVASMCSTWIGDATNQSITASSVVTVHIDDDGATSGNDRLRVTTSVAACAGLFNFGAVDLGSNAFVSSNTTFAGIAANASTIAWDATNYKLTITLGAKATGGNPAKVNSPMTSVYTPAATITNPSGTPATGTASYTGLQL